MFKMDNFSETDYSFSFNHEESSFIAPLEQLDIFDKLNQDRPPLLSFNNFEPFFKNESPIDKERNKKIEFVIKKTNKGRKRKRDVEEESDDDNNSHNKFSSDNLKTKIQVHYISFLISYVNFFLDYFGFTEKFFDIDHKKKRDVQKKNFSLLKETPIGKILSENISQKLTTQQNKEINKSIYQKVINNPIINNLLSEKYETLFKDVYYESKSIVNLKKYGLDKDFKLNKDINMFDSLLEKNRKKIKINEETEQDEYIKALIKCAKSEFIKKE